MGSWLKLTSQPIESLVNDLTMSTPLVLARYLGVVVTEPLEEDIASGVSLQRIEAYGLLSEDIESKQMKLICACAMRIHIWSFVLLH